MVNVKHDFANWLLKNAPDSYNQYLGRSVSSIIERLNEISAFYPKQNFFEVELSKVDQLIQHIKFIFSTKERRNNPKFIEYDKFNSNGIPKALMGKNHYLRFLKEKFNQDSTINYWLFQGNPKVFDFKSALTEQSLDNFTVSAHKDKIKKGDKVIIWITGKEAGCYALAEVTSTPQRVESSADDEHWKIDDPNEIKAGINITHNLYENPILWENIKDQETFANFKAGNQGTNFSATKKEYDTLLNMAESKKFTWVQTYREIIEYLKDKQNQQQELIELLKSSGCDIFNDKAEDGSTIPLDEIDPFTFLCYLNKYFKQRVDILQKLAEKINATKPYDDFGLPSTNPQKVWMFPYKPKRVNDEINRLWSLFYDVLDNTVTDDQFEDVLKIRGIGKTKITEVLFYVNPEKYFPINRPGKAYLQNEFDINPNFSTYQDYLDILKQLREKSNKPFYQLSYEAWHWNDENTKLDRGKIYETLRKKMENSGFKFEAEQNAHGQNRKEKELKFTHPQLIKKFEQDGLNNNAAKFYIKPLSDEENCEIGFATGKTSPLFNASIFSKPNAIDTHNNYQAWVNRENDYALDKLLNSINSYLQNESMKNPLNQILYGPPGTGKTYATKQLAVSIIETNFIKSIDPDVSKNEKRKLITDKYDELHSQGQIVFTTFHQSMSYEDFVEGIKPKMKNKKIIYDIEDGVFKDLSDQARDNWDAINNPNSINLAFDDAFSQLKEDWEEDNGIKFPMKTEGNDFTIIGFTNKSIQFKKASGGTGHTLSINTLREGFYQKRQIRSTGVGIYYKPILNRLNQYKPTSAERSLKSFVLIIDEINRGNVASIFGELITLIEADKRAGAENELSVVLPYSKTKFSVPSNLHIVGTMNTADRSIEALDGALRRRFEFEEMLPKYDLIDNELNDQQYQGFKLSDILRTINERITILINRDHQIGHSYFLKLKGSTNLGQDMKNVFLNKIIPLLQEYFFNDYVKIAMVLGEGFMDKDKYSNIKFAKNVGDYESDYEGITIYEIKKDIVLSEAIKQLMGVEVDES